MTVRKHFRKTFRKTHFSIVFISVLSLLLTPFLGVFPNNAFAVVDNYYVDCANGDDTKDGKSEANAWKTIGQVNNTNDPNGGIGDSGDLDGGDTLYLKRGCVFSAAEDTSTIWSERTLNVPWIGNSTNPVTITAYGTGDYPTIEINTSGTTHAVVITGSYVTIEYIYAKLSSTSDVNVTHEEGTPDYCDIAPNTRNGDNKGFFFKELSTYNILRYSKATGGWAGVKINDTSTNNKILHNVFSDNNMMNPINAGSSGGNGDSGAFGVLIWGANNEIAYNYFSGSSACSFDWGYDGSDVEIYGGDDNNIHHNISKNSNGFSEHGASSTGNSANNTYAYNLMDSNVQGGHFLTVRGTTDSNNYGPSTNTKAYNNTIYLTGSSISPYDESRGFTCTSGCNTTDPILTFKNNIVRADEEVGSVNGTFIEGYNIYSDSDNPVSPTTTGFNPDPTTSKEEDPDFVSGTDFHLLSTSPAKDAGTGEFIKPVGDPLYNVNNKDIDGQFLSNTTAVDIGAYEFGTGSSFNPVHDSYIDESVPGGNYGLDTGVRSDNNPVQKAFVKFDLTPLAGQRVTNAKLRMYITNTSNGTFDVKQVADTTWTEGSITEANDPSLGSLIVQFNPATSSVWVEADVTTYIASKAGTLASMGINTSSTNDFQFNSEEAASNKVELVVTLATVINPTADSYVDSGSSGSNYGTSVDVKSDGSGPTNYTPTQIAYLKFDLHPLTVQTINTAKLRLYVTSASTGTHKVRSISDMTWIESGTGSINYTNRPTSPNVEQASFVPNVSPINQYYEVVDVTSYIDDFEGPSQKFASMAIDTGSSDGFIFNSKEGTNKPELLVTLDQ